MDVHAAAVVADQRLGHEGGRLAVALGDVLDHVFQDLHFVGLAHQGVETDADFALAGGGDFVVMHFYPQTRLLQRQAHGGADVVQGIHRRHREITALDAGPMAEVAALISAFRVPAGLGGINLVEATADVGAPANVVEDKEFVFRTEVGGVGDAGGFQIRLGAAGQRARVAFVTLHGVGLDDVAGQNQGWFFEERVDEGGDRIGHQDHVRFLNALPAGDGRAVEHLAVLEHILVYGANGHGDVLLLAAGIGEAIVHELDALFLDQLHHIGSIHCH